MPFKDKQAKIDYQRAYMRRRRAAAVRPKPEVLDPKPATLDPVRPELDVTPVRPVVTPHPVEPLGPIKPKAGTVYYDDGKWVIEPPFTGPLTKEQQVKGFNKAR